ncbi:MAG: fumarate hydratase [Thermodesulfobacteriota bacterium]|nr:fumarate hydratase [Thermodesulfobacteriota bacterium]
MREIKAADIQAKVADMVIAANRNLPGDVLEKLKECAAGESSASGREMFRQILENADLARETGLPLCQDCGLAVFFVDLGQDCRVTGGGLKQAITQGMVQGYADGYLRKSSCDPLTRENTNDNSPAVIHLDLVPGDALKISFMPKGGGAENMSGVAMLSPAQGWEGVKEFALRSVARAGSNPCPPVILGVGIGATFDTVPVLAKKVLLRPLNDTHPDPKTAAQEQELLGLVNKLGIGPMGLGGDTTCLGVKIETAPCHLACLPVAVNFQCHSARRAEVVL